MDLNGVIVQLLKDVPSLGIMLITVIMFLKHLAKREEIAKVVADQFAEVHRNTADAIKEHVEALQKHNEIIHELVKTVERCKYRQ